MFEMYRRRANPPPVELSGEEREADDTLREFLTDIPCLVDDTAFADSVLAELRQPDIRAGCPETPVLTPHRLANWRRTVFLSQMAGGGLVATVVTFVCVMSTIQSQRNAVGVAASDSATASARIPIPLESLMRAPSPRAALLWAAPPRPQGKTGPRPAARPAPLRLKPAPKGRPIRHEDARLGVVLG